MVLTVILSHTARKKTHYISASCEANLIRMSKEEKGRETMSKQFGFQVGNDNTAGIN